MTQGEGIPVLHKVFEGNIFDARTLPDILLNLRQKKLPKVSLVWDRGVSSKVNIREAKGMGFEVLCGLPLKADLKTVADRVLGEDLVSPQKPGETVEHHLLCPEDEVSDRGN